MNESRKLFSNDKQNEDNSAFIPISEKTPVSDYLKFIFYCALLIIPVYAIVNSALNGNWLIMVIDILLVPVGFIHGVLLLFGIAT